MNEYFNLFEDIGRSINDRFGKITLPFRIIGRAALELAGLPERGTKDVDALEEFLKVGSLSEKRFSDLEVFLKTEFGKGSPGALRHGIYLDLVEKSIAWLPPHPRFIDEKLYLSVAFSRLHPVDVCVSKTFSNFRGGHDRSRDRTDIFETLDSGLADVAEYIGRLDETFSIYETHAEAPDTFPRILKFIDEDILANYSDVKVKLKYSLPSWMENV